MTALSKALYRLHHELLIAKLDAYGFNIKSKKLIQQCISNKKNSIKIGNAHNSWKEIFYGILQGSILDPLILNIFLGNLFYFTNGATIANYVGDTTPYSVNK